MLFVIVSVQVEIWGANFYSTRVPSNNAVSTLGTSILKVWVWICMCRLVVWELGASDTSLDGLPLTLNLPMNLVCMAKDTKKVCDYLTTASTATYRLNTWKPGCYLTESKAVILTFFFINGVSSPKFSYNTIILPTLKLSIYFIYFVIISCVNDFLF